MLESNVKIGVTEISPRAVQQAAELNFKTRLLLLRSTDGYNKAGVQTGCSGFCNRYGFRHGCRCG